MESSGSGSEQIIIDQDPGGPKTYGTLKLVCLLKVVTSEKIGWSGVASTLGMGVW
jgi:hypothetical protein